jgi:hypothetical protein
VPKRKGKNKTYNKNYIEDSVAAGFTIFFEDIDFSRMELLDSVERTLTNCQRKGMSDKEIVKNLYDELMSENGKLDKLDNSETNALWEFMKQTSQDTVFSNCEPEREYEWVVNPGAAHCEGCAEREGQRETFERWEELGLPGTGNTDCHNNCMCYLEEVIK